MLDAIGLSHSESTLYTTLVNSPQSTVAELATQCDIPVAQAARLLAQFARRGLASRLPGRQARYVAVAPDLSIQPMLDRREDELHQVRAAIRELTTAFRRASRQTHPAGLVEVVTGADNIVNRAFAIQDGARSVFRGIDKPPYVMPVAGNNARELHRLGEGVEYRVLYDVQSLGIPGKLADVRASCERGEKARVLAGLPLKLWMADDTAALIPIRGASLEVDAAFIIYPSALLDALIALFELEWKRAIPIRAFTARPSRHRTADLDPAARELLALLAGGLTDEAIARSLGLSLRTVQRRVHEIMDELGASTRFQTGMAARDRGWV